ncbi:MAG: hypothetical protein ACREDR_12860 [Blastocatellia bacterium]
MKSGNGKDDRYYDEGATAKYGEKRMEEVKISAQDAVNKANELGPRGFLGGLINQRSILRLGAGILGIILVAIVIALFARSSSSPATGSSDSASAGTATTESSIPNQASSGQNFAPTQRSASATAPGSPATGAQSGAVSSPPPTNAPSQTLGVIANSGALTDQQQSWPVRIALVALSLALASLLGAVLAFRPRKDIPASRRMPHVVQAEILLAVLGAGVVVVAASSLVLAAAVLALGLFVRIKPSMRDPKESTVMLISAAVGVACGAERWEVAVILAGLAFVILWVLEYPEAQKSQKTVEVAIGTRNIHETNEVLRDIFERNHVSAEFRKVDRDSPDGSTGTIVYLISASGEIGLEHLADDIFSSDPDNVTAVNSCQSRTRQYDLSRV